MKWDIPKIKENRHLAGKPVKAFKAGECLTFRSMAHVRSQLRISRHYIRKHIKSGEPINGYILEWG